jgi:hypothetical protein
MDRWTLACPAAGLALAALLPMLAEAGPTAGLASVAPLPVLTNACPAAGLALVALLPMRTLLLNSFDSLRWVCYPWWRNIC